MIGAKSKHDLSNVQKARIVRAFYDAADRYVEATRAKGLEPQELRLEEVDLAALLGEAKTLTSEEFAERLERAAEIFFARISGETPARSGEPEP